MSSYKERCGDLSVEQKRRDLLCNPLFDKKAISEAPDEDINITHEVYFTAMNAAMENILGESMWDDDW